jgi:hypothetical protein
MKEATEVGDDELSKECQEELECLEKERINIDSRIVDAVEPNDQDDYTSEAIVERVKLGIVSLDAS